MRASASNSANEWRLCLRGDRQPRTRKSILVLSDPRSMPATGQAVSAYKRHRNVITGGPGKIAQIGNRSGALL